MVSFPNPVAIRKVTHWAAPVLNFGANMHGACNHLVLAYTFCWYCTKNPLRRHSLHATVRRSARLPDPLFALRAGGSGVTAAANPSRIFSAVEGGQGGAADPATTNAGAANTG